MLGGPKKDRECEQSAGVPLTWNYGRYSGYRYGVKLGHGVRPAWFQRAMGLRSLDVYRCHRRGVPTGSAGGPGDWLGRPSPAQCGRLRMCGGSYRLGGFSSHHSRFAFVAKFDSNGNVQYSTTLRHSYTIAGWVPNATGSLLIAAIEFIQDPTYGTQVRGTITRLDGNGVIVFVRDSSELSHWGGRRVSLFLVDRRAHRYSLRSRGYCVGLPAAAVGFLITYAIWFRVVLRNGAPPCSRFSFVM